MSGGDVCTCGRYAILLAMTFGLYPLSGFESRTHTPVFGVTARGMTFRRVDFPHPF